MQHNIYNRHTHMIIYWHCLWSRASASVVRPSHPPLLQVCCCGPSRRSAADTQQQMRAVPRRQLSQEATQTCFTHTALRLYQHTHHELLTVSVLQTERLIELQFYLTVSTHTHTQQTFFNSLWSETTRVGRYQKKPSPTHTHPDHRTPLSTSSI